MLLACDVPGLRPPPALLDSFPPITHTFTSNTKHKQRPRGLEFWCSSRDQTSGLLADGNDTHAVKIWHVYSGPSLSCQRANDICLNRIQDQTYMPIYYLHFENTVHIRAEEEPSQPIMTQFCDSTSRWIGKNTYTDE